MTLTVMRALVRGTVKRPSTTALSDAKIDRWINWSQLTIAELYSFPEMKSIDTSVSTVDGTKEYDWPSRTKEVYSVVLIDGNDSRKLDKVDARTMHKDIPYQEEYSEGLSTMYVDVGTSFFLHKIPDDAYQLNIYLASLPVDLVSDSDEPTLLIKDDLIMSGATMRGFLELREIGNKDSQDLYEKWLSIFNEELKVKINTSKNGKSIDSEPVLKPSPSVLGVTNEYWKDPMWGRR